MAESLSSGPRNRGNTRPGGPRGRRQDRADADRQGSPALKNPIQNDDGPSKWRQQPVRRASLLVITGSLCARAFSAYGAEPTPARTETTAGLGGKQEYRVDCDGLVPERGEVLSIPAQSACAYAGALNSLLLGDEPGKQCQMVIDPGPVARANYETGRDATVNEKSVYFYWQDWERRDVAKVVSRETKKSLYVAVAKATAQTADGSRRYQDILEFTDADVSRRESTIARKTAMLLSRVCESMLAEVRYRPIRENWGLSVQAHFGHVSEEFGFRTGRLGQVGPMVSEFLELMLRVHSFALAVGPTHRKMEVEIHTRAESLLSRLDHPKQITGPPACGSLRQLEALPPNTPTESKVDSKTKAK